MGASASAMQTCRVYVGCLNGDHEDGNCSERYQFTAKNKRPCINSQGLCIVPLFNLIKNGPAETSHLFRVFPFIPCFYICAHLDAPPLPAETLQRFHHHGAAKVVNDLWLLGEIGSRQGQAEATTTGSSSRRQHRVLCRRSRDLTAKEIATCP